MTFLIIILIYDIRIIAYGDIKRNKPQNVVKQAGDMIIYAAEAIRGGIKA